MSSSGGLPGSQVKMFVEACRLKGIKIQVTGNVGVDILKVLKKDAEQRVKRSAMKTGYQRAIDALKNDMKPAEKAFHEDIQLIIKYAHTSSPP